MAQINELKYFISKSLSELYQKEFFDTIELAQQSIPEDEKNCKWHCFARFKKNDETKFRYAHLSYYDCVSPNCEIKDQMTWYNYKEYKNDPVAISKFNKSQKKKII